MKKTMFIHLDIYLSLSSEWSHPQTLWMKRAANAETETDSSRRENTICMYILSYWNVNECELVRVFECSHVPIWTHLGAAAMYVTASRARALEYREKKITSFVQHLKQNESSANIENTQTNPRKLLVSVNTAQMRLQLSKHISNIIMNYSDMETS